MTDENGKTGYMNGDQAVTNVNIPSGQYGEATITFTVTLSAPNATGSDDEKAAKLDAAISALAANDSPYVAAIPQGTNSAKIRAKFGNANSSYAETGGATASTALTLTQDGTTHKWNTVYTFSNCRVSLVAGSGAEAESAFENLSVDITVGYINNLSAFVAYGAAV